MLDIRNIILVMLTFACIWGCGVKTNYNFTGIALNAKNFQVDYFKNVAVQSPGSIFEPGTDRDFTVALQNRILNQTELDLVGTNGDLQYEGEIVEYRISPMSATAQQNASQNRLSMAVAVRFYAKSEKDTDFEKRFSFFYDYPANSSLASVKEEAHEIIFERITQDIFNTSLLNW